MRASWIICLAGALGLAGVVGCKPTSGTNADTPATRGDRTVPHTSDGQGPGNNSPPIVGEKTHLKGGLGGKR